MGAFLSIQQEVIMFQRLLLKLGYVPVSLLNQEKSLTDSQAKIILNHQKQAQSISNENLRLISENSAAFNEIRELGLKATAETKKAKGLLRKNNVLLKKQGTFKERIRALENDLHQMGTDAQTQDRIISELDLELSTLKSKYQHECLLNQELQEQVNSLQKEKQEIEEDTKDLLTKLSTVVNQANALPYALEINKKLQEKLEYLCFGSVLPYVLRPSTLNQYQYPIKSVKLDWKQDGIYANVGDTDAQS